MIRHEIMTKRTKAEINKLADAMCKDWRESNVDNWSREKALRVIFCCLDGAAQAYEEKESANG